MVLDDGTLWVIDELSKIEDPFLNDSLLLYNLEDKYLENFNKQNILLRLLFILNNNINILEVSTPKSKKIKRNSWILDDKILIFNIDKTGKTKGEHVAENIELDYLLKCFRSSKLPKLLKILLGFFIYVYDSNGFSTKSFLELNFDIFKEFNPSEFEGKKYLFLSLIEKLISAKLINIRNKHNLIILLNLVNSKELYTLLKIERELFNEDELNIIDYEFLFFNHFQQIPYISFTTNKDEFIYFIEQKLETIFDLAILKTLIGEVKNIKIDNKEIKLVFSKKFNELQKNKFILSETQSISSFKREFKDIVSTNLYSDSYVESILSIEIFIYISNKKSIYDNENNFIFMNAIKQGFLNNKEVAIRVLIPQLENTLRNYLLSFDIFNEFLTIEDILDYLDETLIDKEYLDKFKHYLIRENNGLNIRNKLSHGKSIHDIPENELNNLFIDIINFYLNIETVLKKTKEIKNIKFYNFKEANIINFNEDLNLSLYEFNFYFKFSLLENQLYKAAILINPALRDDDNQKMFTRLPDYINQNIFPQYTDKLNYILDARNLFFHGKFFSRIYSCKENGLYNHINYLERFDKYIDLFIVDEYIHEILNDYALEDNLIYNIDYLDEKFKEEMEIFLSDDCKERAVKEVIKYEKGEPNNIINGGIKIVKIDLTMNANEIREIILN